MCVNRISTIPLALCAAAMTAAAPAPAASQTEPPPKLQQLMQSCDAHKFETTVDTTENGQPHKSRVKLCGVEGQSDSDWIGTLKDAIAKLDANKDMDPAVRKQIVTAINGEIARIEAKLPAGDTATAFNLAPAADNKTNQGLPPGRPIESAEPPLSNDYATLPSIPTRPPPPPRVLAPAAAMSAAASLHPVPLHLGPAPKLSYQCYSPGDVGGAAPCTEFDRETLLTINAASDVARGVALQFIRNGDQRAQVDLAGLERGKSLQIVLPKAVCEGFGDGRLDLKIVEQGAEVKTDGPYSLRC